MGTGAWSFMGKKGYAEQRFMSLYIFLSADMN